MTIRAFVGLLIASVLPLLAHEGEHTGPEEVQHKAEALLALLNEEQKAVVSFALNDDERENWHYVPLDRAGLLLKALDEKQKDAVQELLGSSLSAQGQATARDVIRLEEQLYERSGNSDYRDPGKYSVAIFGTPSTEQPWGWRFEGHHLSLNFTIVDEKVALTTPFFFGTNPAETREGDLKGLRPLGKIEDAARELANEMHMAGKHVRYTNEAPHEILTGQDRTAQPLAGEGVAYVDLEEKFQKSLLALVKQVAENQRPEFLSVSADDLAQATFAWAGDFGKGEPHYFRVQTPEFLIEYANTQNNANHAHLVWRDFDGDFGRDVLGEHLKNDH
ncbi:DUF3500 domain-containing protein [Roseibacillus ishigakijimensis]|uniref:DUF3500 domain-containing protein n=1 Tax=Roseibacillus ishigakijimensis TaxID=454146 RepID=A0A934RPX1_9BACT|nr:DUF3500 domain-containing protein [Roseibacillus ishigakijimensis]MBK1834788.1 DUF3500 domain-containing protein [Roseibacillus ishigakijimensis]